MAITTQDDRAPIDHAALRADMIARGISPARRGPRARPMARRADAAPGRARQGHRRANHRHRCPLGHAGGRAVTHRAQLARLVATLDEDDARRLLAIARRLARPRPSCVVRRAVGCVLRRRCALAAEVERMIG